MKSLTVHNMSDITKGAPGGPVSNGTNGRVNGGRPDFDKLETDVIIVGGGFGGIYGMYKFRKLGLKVNLVEAGAAFGGTWFWNRYPGARVDSETPYYSLAIPEVFNSWNFSSRFPGHEELRRYFDHMDKTLDLSKDTYFNTIVEGAHYNTDEGKWKVKSANGQTATCTYLVMATGSTHKANYPKFQDLDKYKGVLIHSSRYPQDLNVSGKKVCVIGSGATGLQIVQTLAREDCQLTACVRTPNFSLPMRQRNLTAEEQDTAKSYYPAWLHAARASKGGFPYDNAKGFFDVTPKERQELYELLWSRGGFNYVGGNYIEMLFNKDANREIYKFWAEKTRKRVQDPIKRDIIAPLEQPYWFATKRPSLEQDYYEMLDRDNVKLIGLKKNPIDRFTANGIRFGGQEGFDADFDIIILATGFDAITGTLVDFGIVGADGISLQKRWSEGVSTYLGLMVPHNPNMFMVYSPQAPTALSNAPPAIEVQIDWIVDAIKAMREQGITSITADPAAAAKWRARIHEVFNMTLYPETDSWWNGANVDGKLKEPVLFMEGLDTYDSVIKDALNGWQGFQTVKA
ncbi:dimethylaniline monooxygenase [Pyrenophora seminiperda CCB06]|uniref:Dimethylaniline monooxygenase n=1 Tax=Pyrenophora seminiperda CCB06 TaxID=1302712 RepID=A0A3M7M1E2_9PLEO|nr:dimethylaniline monooxygenase [Pyrenophora seminiperda CCB06]